MRAARHSLDRRVRRPLNADLFDFPSKNLVSPSLHEMLPHCTSHTSPNSSTRPYPYASDAEVPYFLQYNYASVVSLSAYLNCYFQLPPCDSGDVRAHVQYGAAIFTPLSFEGGGLSLAALSYCILTPVPETRVEGIAHVDPHLMYALNYLCFPLSPSPINGPLARTRCIILLPAGLFHLPLSIGL